MDKNHWTEQHSQLWTTPKRSAVLSSAERSAPEKTAEKSDGERHLSAGQIVHEILVHLEGGSAAVLSSESSLEDRLYRVLVKVEECEEHVEAALGRTKTKSDANALTEKTKALQEALLSSVDVLPSKKGVREDGDLVHHISDVLKTYGEIETDADAANVLLSVIKDYERLKCDAMEREADAQKQEQQLNQRLSFYGDVAAEVEGNPTTHSHWRPWVETPLSLLYEEVSKTLSLLGEAATSTVVEPFLSPNAAQSRKNISTVLNSAMECVERLRLRLALSSSVTPQTSSYFYASTAENQEQPDTCYRATVEALITSFPPEIATEFQLAHLSERRSSELPAAILRSVRTLSSRPEGGTDKALFIINSLDRSLRRAFHLGQTEDDEEAALSLSHALRNLEKRVADILAYPHESPQRESELAREMSSAVDELAQLLPASPDCALPICSGVRIEPPTQNLSEMVQLLKTRFLAWSQRQQKQLLSGAHKRIERDRALEVVAKYLKDLRAITLEMGAVRLVDGSTTAEATGLETLADLSLEDTEGSSPVSVEVQLNNLQDRLRTLKTQYIKMNQDTSSLRSRLEASTQRNTVQSKNLKKAASLTTRLCEVLRIDASCLKQVPLRATDGSKAASGDTSHERLSLRSSQDKSPRGQCTAEVTETNLVDALRAVEMRVSGDEALLKRSEAEHHEEQAAALAIKREKDKAAFAEAMRTIVLRLAECGKLIKQSLFMLGTDESATDDAVEDALTVLDARDGVAGPQAGGAEAVERLLAALLQKYSRWSRRLCETTEDHLVTQQKIVKYFTAIRRFFSPPENTAKNGADALDENLIDIDTSLMQSADVILPALDRAVRAVEDDRSERDTADKDPDARRKDAVGHLAGLSSSGSTVLPYDHRLGRLYDMISRLYTTVTSLQKVRYLAIPCDAKQRSSGDIELSFDDGYAPSDYIDLDLDKLVAGPVSSSTPASQSARFMRQGVLSPSSATEGSGSSGVSTSANDERILQAATQNLDCVQQALKKFSSDHKLGAIIIQKDTDTMQQLLAGMLEKYSELDVEKAFGQDRVQLRDLYTLLHERAGRQKGCYFFNRVGGEGKCVWASALEQLSTGFTGIIDKLIQRTDLASKYRDLIDDVVDLSAMFVNWTEQHALPPGHELTDSVLEDCVREGDDSGADDDHSSGNAHATTNTKSSLPPMLPRPGTTAVTAEARKTAPASAVVSHFRHDATVLKVIEKMFRLVQASAEREAGTESGPRAASAGAMVAEEEELALLRETLAVADQRAAALAEEKRLIELERDRAQSEAAVARAELRRGQKGSLPTPASPSQPPASITPHPHGSAVVADSSKAATSESLLTSRAEAMTARSSASAPSNSIDQDCLEELLQYMKALGHELQYAKSVARSEGGTTTAADGEGRGSAAAPAAGENGEVESFTDEEDSAPASMPGGDGELMYAAVASPMTRLKHLKALERRLQEEFQTPLVIEATELRRNASRSAGGNERRYSPSKHRGGDYEVCEGCVRHHGRPMPQALQSPYEHAGPRTPASTVPATSVHMGGATVTTPRGSRGDLTTTHAATVGTPRARVRSDSVRKRAADEATSLSAVRSQRRPSQRPRLHPDASPLVSTQVAQAEGYEEVCSSQPERFFDDDLYTRSGARQRPTTGGRPTSARRFHPLRSNSLTSRPAGLGYGGADPLTGTARPAASSPYMPASPPTRGASQGSRRRDNGSGNISARGSGTPLHSRTRVGRARSPDQFDEALRTVQEAGSGSYHGVSASSQRRHEDSLYAGSANLRSTALRRLAEVVSQTKVKGPGGRYY